MCTACHRTREQAYPTMTPRGLLELLNSSDPAREEFVALQARVVNARTSGGRARLPPVVHLERTAERVVSEAPFRWVREADYNDIFGNTPEFNTHGEPVWEQLQPGEWEFGYNLLSLTLECAGCRLMLKPVEPSPNKWTRALTPVVSSGGGNFWSLLTL